MKYIWIVLLLIPLGLVAQTITPLAATQSESGTPSDYMGQDRGSRPDGPEISEISWVPQAPESDNTITVSATIIDDSSVEEAFLEYRLESQTTWYSDDMQEGTATRYSGHLPTLASLTDQADNFVIRIHAVDDDDNDSVSPEQTIQVTLVEGDYTPIADIQGNTAAYVNQEVTILAAVTLGAGILRDDMLTVYVQDTSGAGLELFDYDISQAYLTDLVRGNLLEITGTVEEYNSVCELTGFTYTVRESNIDMTPYTVATTIPAIDGVSDEGTYVSLAASVVSIGTAGEGTNLTVADGDGNEMTLRIWNTTGIDTSIFANGDPLLVKGVVSSYNSAPQLLPGYQEDLINLNDPITDIAWTPEMPFMADSIYVTARIEDASTVTSATLFYRRASAGSYTSVPMTALGNHNYRGVLPPMNTLTDGQDNFLIRVEAYDTSGNHLVSQVQTVEVFTGSPIIESYTCRSTAMDMYTYVPNPFNDEEVIITATVIDYNGSIAGVNVHYGAYSAGEPDSVMTMYEYTSHVWRATLPPFSTYGTSFDQLVYRIEATDNEGNVTRTALLRSVIAARAPIVYGLALLNSPNLGDSLRVSTHIFDTNGYLRDQCLYYSLDFNDHKYRVELSRDHADSTYFTAVIPPQGSGKTVNISIYALDNEGYTSDYFPANEDQIVEYTYPITSHKAVLKIPPKAFNPYEGETIPIDFYGKKGDHAVLRIYNAEGKLILTAANLNITSDTGIGRYDWNGRNHLQRLQPLGLYICHLEITNAQTGKKMTDQAPIVIGDRLK